MAKIDKPTLFINCSKECYQDFLRTELSYFDFVRDRFEADIQILIIEQEQSNGGKQFTLQFIGNNNWASKSDTILLSVLQAATPDEIRAKFLQQISIYLVRVISLNSINDNLLIRFPRRETAEIDTVKDKWNFWVFSPGIEGWAEGGTNNMWANLKSDFTIRRIDNQSKFIAKPYYNLVSSFFNLNSVKLSGTAADYGINLLYAKSLNQHWSFGGITQLGHNYFLNIARTYKVAPVIEYNIFPFSINTIKQIRIAYQIGVSNFNYIDTTVFNLISETRPYNRLTLNIEYNRPWGSIMTGLYYNAYLDNFNQNRSGFNANFSLRIFEGFSLIFEGEGFFMNDQISLLRKPLPNEAYLLGTQQLRAKFNYRLNFGIRYTFGSIFNNIVNPRFGNIE
ncbi:MAG: hypothetical protein EAZ07_01715 [Cytophagales bacterium]|nr:MAG: hypothetical protein EAZ07_01715 [Cytophagales bacterium]